MDKQSLVGLIMSTVVILLLGYLKIQEHPLIVQQPKEQSKEINIFIAKKEGIKHESRAEV